MKMKLQGSLTTHCRNLGWMAAAAFVFLALFTGTGAIAADPIKIGVSVPLSSVAGAIAEQVYRGAELAARGTESVQGRQIQLVKIDDKGHPDGAAAAMKRLVELDKVDAIVGINTTPAAMAIKDYIAEHKVPTVINAVFQDLTMDLGNPYLFRASYSDAQVDYPMADWVLKNAPGKRAVTIALDYAPSYVFVGKFKEVFVGDGREVTKQLWVPIGNQDLAPYLSQIDPNTDVILAHFFGADSVRFARGLRDFGLNKKMIAGLSLTIEPQQLGESGVGIVNVMAYTHTINTPLNRQFVADYRKAYSSDPSEYSAIGYTEMQMVLAAIQSVKGDVTRQSITDALAKVELRDSIRGPLKFDSHRNVVTNIHIGKVEKIDGGYHNVVIDTYPNVSQFWKSTPQEYIANKKPYTKN